MAKIPMGNFGQSMPQVERISMPQNHSGQMIANALGNVGRATDEYVQNQKKEQIKLDDIEATTKISQFAIEAENMGADYRQKVASGLIKSQDADLEFSKQYGVRVDEVMGTLPASVRESYKKQLINYGTGQISTLYKTGREVENDTAKTSFSQTLDNAARITDEMEADKIMQAAYASVSEVLTPSETMESYKMYRGKRASYGVGSRIAAAKSEEDFKGIIADLDDGKYQALTPESEIATRKAAESGVERAQKQAIIAQNKRESEASSAVSELKSNILSGGAVDPQYIIEKLSLAKGTKAEEEANFWANNSPGIQKFRNMNTNKQKSIIDKMNQEYTTNPSKNAKDRGALLSIYQGIYNDSVSSAKSDNSSVANGLGFDVKNITGVELLSNPSQAVGVIFSNLRNLNEAKKHEPNISLNPISEQTKMDLQQSFANSNSQQKLSVLSEIMKQARSNNIPKDSAIGVIETIGGGNKDYNVAAQAVASNLIYQGKSVGGIILSGASAIKKGTHVTPTELDKEFRGKISNLSLDLDYNATYAAMKSAYAFFESQSGHVSKSKDDPVNEESFKKALDSITGGVYQQHNTDFFGSGKFKTADGSVDNWMVQKPYMMKDATFETSIESGFNQVGKQLKINPEYIKNNFRLQARDDTAFKNSVVYDLLDANGNPWVVNGKVQMIIIQNKGR
ncbi:hypothetical protein [Acinetobacter sp. ULE_I092]|uniref:hypothetical protein n=1 Tax=Acinetobacter sp. ULE_I092 TaxID=3373075 RepID=UPI003AF61DC6